MRITVLGAGTFQPTPKRGCPGYLLDINNEKVLLDAGSGCLRQLSYCGVDPAKISCILISHLHVDHTGDLLPILFSRKNLKKYGLEDLRIYGPRGLRKVFSYYNEIYPDMNITTDTGLVVGEYSETGLSRAGWGIEVYPLNHSIENMGIRISANAKTIAYSGDTDVCENAVKLCKNADIAILECTVYDENKIQGHLTPSEAGQIAEKAGCETLMLSHLGPGLEDDKVMESCSKYYSGKILIAEELKTIRV